ncbi:hypothetical protein IV505_03200 [Pseudomonas fulva]|nr:hypothetical protein [Pseudomonas fulva]MBF8778743.1 hypothetical protein [Pseudomonas fulva]
MAEAPAKPRGRGRQLALAALVLVSIGGYAAYQARAGKALQQFEADLAAGQACLRSERFDCALDNAGRALGIDSKDPRAISLLQRAQAGLERQQRQQDAKAQAAAVAKAQAQAAARQAAAEQARQAAAEQARRDGQARELAEQQRLASERTKASQAKALQELLDQQAEANRKQQQHLERQRQAQAQATPPAARQAKAPINPGLVGQQLSQARNALARRDANAARALASAVLRQDPSNRQAQNILRQAEQLRSQRQGASFDTPKALGGVIIE